MWAVRRLGQLSDIIARVEAALATMPEAVLQRTNDVIKTGDGLEAPRKFSPEDGFPWDTRAKMEVRPQLRNTAVETGGVVQGGSQSVAVDNSMLLMKFFELSTTVARVLVAGALDQVDYEIIVHFQRVILHPA